MTHLLSARATADLLDVSYSFLLNERKAGRIGYVKIGGSFRFTQEDIDNYITASRVQPTVGFGRGILTRRSANSR